MQSGKLSKVEIAQSTATRRSKLDRMLDHSNLSVQLDPLIKAASASDKSVEIRLNEDVKHACVIPAQKTRCPYGTCAAGGQVYSVFNEY